MFPEDIMMVNFFGMDITENNKNEEYAGKAFCTMKTPADKLSRIERILGNAEELDRKRDLPLPLQIIKDICGFITVIDLICVPIVLIRKTFPAMYRNAPAIVWLMGICPIVWLLLTVMALSKAKTVEDSAEFSDLKKKSFRLMDDIKEALNIPEDAKEIEVLQSRFVMKDGKEKLKASGICPYINNQLWAFIRENDLCLADVYGVWEIPLSSIRSVEYDDSNYMLFPNWFKEEPYDSEIYRQYEVRNDGMGRYMTKTYRVTINDPKGDFYILIPDYDGQAFMDLTGIRQ